MKEESKSQRRKCNSRSRGQSAIIAGFKKGRGKIGEGSQKVHTVNIICTTNIRKPEKVG